MTAIFCSLWHSGNHVRTVDIALLTYMQEELDCLLCHNYLFISPLLIFCAAGQIIVLIYYLCNGSSYSPLFLLPIIICIFRLFLHFESH